MMMQLQFGRSTTAVQAILREPQPRGRFGAMYQFAGMREIVRVSGKRAKRREYDQLGSVAQSFDVLR